MTTYENDCVGCDVCYHCGAKKTKHIICDDCGEEKPIYDYEGEELCIDCIEQRLRRIN